MRWTRVLLAGLLIAATAAGAMAAFIYRYDEGGKLAPVAAAAPEKGKYKVSIVTKGGQRGEHIALHAYKLDRTKDESGLMPVFHVWMVSSDGSTEADFGKLPTNKFGHGYFVFDSRRDEFPAGTTTFWDFEDGGKVEVRGPAGTVLRADVGSFKRTRIGGSAGGGYGGGGY